MWPFKMYINFNVILKKYIYTHKLFKMIKQCTIQVGFTKHYRATNGGQYIQTRKCLLFLFLKLTTICNLVLRLFHMREEPFLLPHEGRACEWDWPMSQNRDHTEVWLSRKSVTTATSWFAMIHRQNALASCHVPSQCACEGHSPPWTYTILNASRGWMPLVSTLDRNMVTALQQLHQNHRCRQEVGLLYGLYSVPMPHALFATWSTWVCSAS
jgi:hypothetical protein